MQLLYMNLEMQGATHNSTAFFAMEFSEQFLDSNTNPPLDQYGWPFWLSLYDADGQHNE
jgi:hypothetical protein